jgi:hypothetical protein
VVDRAILAHKIGLLAHQYGALDWSRVHAIAASELNDLLSFARALAERAEEGP